MNENKTVSLTNTQPGEYIAAGEDVIEKGQTAWSRIKSDSKMMRDDWDNVGEALAKGREIHPINNNSYGKWCEDNGFGDIDRRLRADAIWLAENKGVVGNPDNPQDLVTNNNPTDIRKAHRKIENKKALETAHAALEAKETAAPTGLYDVIVIDPPWPMVKIEREVRPNQVVFDYPVMEEEEICDLELPAQDNCHVWVWTTHKFLPMALRCIEAWDLKYVCTFVWHKPGGFQPIGLPQYNGEFAIYARKGTPTFVDTKAFNTVFQAPRMAHSEKPEEFYDVVRRVTSGQRLDMFNRREIEGFTGWGNESE